MCARPVLESATLKSATLMPGARDLSCAAGTASNELGLIRQESSTVDAIRGRNQASVNSNLPSYSKPPIRKSQSPRAALSPQLQISVISRVPLCGGTRVRREGFQRKGAAHHGADLGQIAELADGHRLRQDIADGRGFYRAS